MEKKILVIEIKLPEQLEDLALDLESIANQLSYLSRNTEQESESMITLADDELSKFMRGKAEILNSIQSKVLEGKE